MALLFGGACGGAPNVCPATLDASPTPRLDAIQFGGDSARVEAQITQVKAECFRELVPAVHTKDYQEPEHFVYRLAFLANVHYTIADTSFFSRATAYQNLRPQLVFLAASEGGVVLDSATSAVPLTRNGSDDIATASLTASPEVMQRIAHIRARWHYGRPDP